MNDKEAIKNLKDYIECLMEDYGYYKDIVEFRDSVEYIEKRLQTQQAEIEKKDKEIQFQKEINKTEQERHKQTEKSLKGQLEKKDKQIEQYQNMLATNDMLHVLECERKDKMIDLMAEEFENLKLAYFKKEDGGEFMGKYRTYNKNDWKQYFKEKVENGR